MRHFWRVDFRDSLNSKFSAAAGYEWSPYLGASLLGARARSIGRLSTPEIKGRFAEGLGIPGEAKVLSALKSLKVKDKNRVVVEVGFSRLYGYWYTNVDVIKCAVHYTSCAGGADEGPEN
jgi:hypothetical protein